MDECVNQKKMIIVLFVDQLNDCVGFVNLILRNLCKTILFKPKKIYLCYQLHTQKTMSRLVGRQNVLFLLIFLIFWLERKKSTLRTSVRR